MNNPASHGGIGRGKIFIEGLRLHAFHGHFAHERKHGQMFEIDLDLVVDLDEAAAGDDLRATVDYGKVVAATRQVFCGEPRKLVEAAALDVARALLEKFVRLESVMVRVGKIAPPIAATLRAAGVEIEVKRGA
ncbi:MAG: dihydroneopterin aldolase [Roseiarcus sp.]|jgi:dihydroneopterin aldolase